MKKKLKLDKRTVKDLKLKLKQPNDRKAAPMMNDDPHGSFNC